MKVKYISPCSTRSCLLFLLFLISTTVAPGCGEDDKDDNDSDNGSLCFGGPCTSVSMEDQLETAINNYEKSCRSTGDNLQECYPDDPEFDLGEWYAGCGRVNKLYTYELNDTLVECGEKAAQLFSCFEGLSCSGWDEEDSCSAELEVFEATCKDYSTQEEPLPEKVNISVTGALINVIKYTEKPWDGPGGASEDAITAFANVAGAPYASAFGYLGGEVIDQFSPPDAFGTVEIDVGDGFEDPQQLPSGVSSEDTFTPIWSPGANFNGVSLQKGIRLRVTLEDKDLSTHDPIGTVELAFDDFVEAWYADQIHHVYVGDQAFDQLLYISISVRTAN